MRLTRFLIPILLVLFVVNSLTHTRQFPYDAMNYVDVARHVAQGDGLVQTTVGMFQPRLAVLPSDGPVPFVAQAPLFPLLIAALHALGASFQDAALLLSALGYLLTLGLGTLLARRFYGDGGAQLVLVALLVYAPLAQAGRTALTEALALGLLLGSLALVTAPERHLRAPELAAAGLLAGLAFATRYALVAWIPLGLLWILWRSRGRALPGAVAYVLGAALPVVPILIRNIALAGELIPRPLPSDQGWQQNTTEAAQALLGNFFLAEKQQVAQSLVSLVFLGIVFLWKRRSLRLRNVPHRPDVLLLLWALIYTSGLILQRTRVHFDPLDSRLLLPAGVPFLILLGNLAGNPRAVRTVLALGLLLVLGRELKIFRTPLEAPAIVRSPRLAWLAKNTTNADCILGDDAMDIPFFLERPRVFSFSAYPYNEPVDGDFLQRIAPVYVVVRPSEGVKDVRYGPTLAGLKQGKLPPGLRITEQVALHDARIYRIEAERTP